MHTPVAHAVVLTRKFVPSKSAGKIFFSIHRSFSVKSVFSLHFHFFSPRTLTFFFFFTFLLFLSLLFLFKPCLILLFASLPIHLLFFFRVPLPFHTFLHFYTFPLSFHILPLPFHNFPVLFAPALFLILHSFSSFPSISSLHISSKHPINANDSFYSHHFASLSPLLLCCFLYKKYLRWKIYLKENGNKTGWPTKPKLK